MMTDMEVVEAMDGMYKASISPVQPGMRKVRNAKVKEC
jgi:hypothetical protein